MERQLKTAAEAVGAFVVCGADDMFLGATHTRGKQLSEKLPSQISFFTETKRKGESDQNALSRLLTEEEVIIRGVSDTTLCDSTKLSDSLLRTRVGNATLTTYLFHAPENPAVEIIDGEIAQVGLIRFNDILNAPTGSWWIRWGVREAVKDVLRLRQNPNGFSPSLHLDFGDRVPSSIFNLLKNGLSEAEALSRLGLHAPDQPLPYSFVRLQSQPVHH